MQITNLKINDMQNPIGYDFHRLSLSYTIDQEPNPPLLLVIREGSLNGEIVHQQSLDYAFSFCTEIDFVPRKETRYYLQIRSGETASEGAFFETGTTFDCDFITPEDNISHPVFFQKFQVSKEIEKARLYVTGLGLYEAYLNGRKAGNEFLAPGCNDYDVYLQYQTYDVSSFLSQDNLLEIRVGNGWYKGRFGLQKKSNIFGHDFLAAAKLVVWYRNGTKETAVRTDSTWKARPSFVVDSGIYDGEIQNADQEKMSVCSVKKISRTFNVRERISLPIVVKQRIKPTLVVSPIGEQILDFGQNCSGFVAFAVEMEKGQTIRLQAGEVLQRGCFYRDNLRTAKAEFQYTSDGIKREIRPLFTFYGFRYMLVEGLAVVDPEDFIGNVIFSDLEETVEIRTNDAKMNRLLQNCLWSQRSNFVDVPTDCPQRDERLGWTGDAAVFSKTACYQMNCQPFFDKYLQDMKIDQDRLNGMISTYSPACREDGAAGSVWSDAATIIPWNVYTAYGDKGFLRRHYPMMERYVRSLIEKDESNGKERLIQFGFHLGDWLSQDGNSESSLWGATSEYFIASAYYYNSLRILGEASGELGYSEKEQYFKGVQDEVKKAFLREYFSPSGRLAIDTQTAFALCVNFDLFRDEEKLVRGFSERIRKDSYKIKGGFVGATQLIQALIKCGLTDDAFRFLYSETFPSWLYCVNLGATTIWERWNSLNPDGSMSGTGMNSLNHYAYGSVAEAFYSYAVGLRPLIPGYKKAVIEPKFNYRLRSLDFSYVSPSGKFLIKYQIIGPNQVDFFLRVPFGVEVILVLGEERHVLAGGEYHFAVTSTKDFDHPYSLDSKGFELVSNPISNAILGKYVPGLQELLGKKDLGFHGESLRKLCSLTNACSKEIMEEMNQALSQILYSPQGD